MPANVTQLPLELVLGMVAAGVYPVPSTNCAGCNRNHREGEHYSPGLWVWPKLSALAFYSLCDKCLPRLHEFEFGERIKQEAYRSLFDAGPDDVAGSA
jgi:hypothetical protein